MSLAALDPGVVHEACCSHPLVVEDTGLRTSRAFRDAEQLLAPFDAPLPRPPAASRLLGFECKTLAEVHRLVEHSAARAGMETERAQDLVLAVGEVAANSIRHGGGRGTLRIWRDGGALVCEVRDRGHIGDPLAGRHTPGTDQVDGRGLWIANGVCDLVQVRSGVQGTAVRLRMTL